MKIIFQPRVHQYDPAAARPLLLIACSGAKLHGEHRAGDLYQGVMFAVLRKWIAAANPPDVYIISAKHGLVHASTVIESYEQEMTQERAEALAEKGIDVREFLAKSFNEVFIAGGARYRALAQTYVARLREAGFLAPNAEAYSTSGGIGEQRSQLGAYLRQLGENAPAGAAALALEIDVQFAKIKQGVEAARQWAATDSAARRAIVTTPGTTLKWSTLAGWMDAWTKLHGRAPKAQLHEQKRAHLEQLALHLPIVSSEVDPAVLARAKAMVEALQPPRGQRAAHPTTVALQLIGTRLNEVRPAPLFRRGVVLVRRQPIDVASDEIRLMEDIDKLEAERVRTPAEGTLLVRVEYRGDREKIKHRWQTPMKSAQMDAADIARHYVIKDASNAATTARKQAYTREMNLRMSELIAGKKVNDEGNSYEKEIKNHQCAAGRNQRTRRAAPGREHRGQLQKVSPQAMRDLSVARRRSGRISSRGFPAFRANRIRRLGTDVLVPLVRQREARHLCWLPAAQRGQQCGGAVCQGPGRDRHEPGERRWCRAVHELPRDGDRQRRGSERPNSATLQG